MSEAGEHAVVLGASMGGLLAARVLADAYRRVTIAERDPLPESGLDRKGVPQGRHAHVLLPRGAQILDELFRDYTQPSAAGGVPVLHHPREIRILLSGHLLCQHGEPGSRRIGQARPHLEHQVRNRVRALPNVVIRDRCDVAGLVTAPTRDRVTGAGCGRRRRRRRKGTNPGRRSRRRRDRPHRADPGVAQRTRLRPAGRGADPSRHQIRQPVSAAAPRSTGGREAGLHRRRTPTAHHHGACRPEDNRWILTLAGYSGHHPPPARTGSRPSPSAWSPVTSSPRSATPARSARSAPTGSRPVYGGATNGCAASRRAAGNGRRSVQLRPVYSQGMTMTALQAATLRTPYPAANTTWPPFSRAPAGRSTSPGG